tara:strand:+ start:197 stop:967 length:771 start_codon:yes stop_codon:yes gene_type:complete
MRKAKLNHIIPELERVNGGRLDFEWDDIKYLMDNCYLDKKFSKYVAGKKIILMGPSPYTLNHERGEWVDNHDIVIRMNKSFPVKDEHKKYIGSRTDIRYHCMNTYHRHGGEYLIDEMIGNGTKWLCSQFPDNLDYFHNDHRNFESQNNEKIDFHVWGDLEQYLTYHHYLGTRMNTGTACIADLLSYDIKNIHISGVTFFREGWVDGYKEKEYDSNQEDKSIQFGNHAMAPQIKLIKLFYENDDRVSVDKEVEDILN